MGVSYLHSLACILWGRILATDVARLPSDAQLCWCPILVCMAMCLDRDALTAATALVTALVQGKTVVTRIVRHFWPRGVVVLNFREP